METLEPIEGVFYKTVLVMPDGSRVSPWARGKKGSVYSLKHQSYGDYPELEYKEGSLVIAPEESPGISIIVREPIGMGERGCEGGKKMAHPGSHYAIHECQAFGVPIPVPGAGNGKWAKAIILGKEILAEEVLVTYCIKFKSWIVQANNVGAAQSIAEARMRQGEFPAVLNVKSQEVR